MKTACIYHSVDLDGWMSAAIVKHWHESSMKSQENITGQSQKEYNQIDFIGYNYGQPIPDLTDYDDIIMCDISFPNEAMTMFKIREEGRFIWIDHHISAIKDNENLFYSDEDCGIRDTKFAACELTWMYFFPSIDSKSLNDNPFIPEIVRLLGRYDCFGHKGTDEETKVLEFQYGARQFINNYESAYDYLIMSLDHIPYSPRIEEKIRNAGVAIYQYLCTEAKQTYKNGFEIEFILGKQNNTKYHLCDRCKNSYPECLASEIKFGDGLGNDNILDCDCFEPITKYKFLAINKERFNPINFGIDYHKPIDEVWWCIKNPTVYGLLTKNGTFTINSDNSDILKFKTKDEGIKFLDKYETTSKFVVVEYMWTKPGYDGCACFWYANGMWNFSLYNDNGEVDCSAIAKEFGGGGHKGAAGFKIKNIESFITANKI